MGSLLNTLWRSVILDDAAFQDWSERPNVFLRGIVLIILVTLVAEIIVFGINLVNQVQPVDLTAIPEEMNRWYETQSQWTPEMGPEFRKAWEGTMDVMFPMFRELSQIKAPLPQGIIGFLDAVGGWLARAVAALGGWLLYGSLVLIAVRLLGGRAKLPLFLGSVALYIVPGLLAVLQPITCIGLLLAFVGTVWSIVVYMKATSVVTGLDTGRAIVAVVAPFFIITTLSILLFGLTMVWFAIIF
jgi:hypothetical protein